MVKIYITDVSCLPDPKENEKVMRGLTDDRREKILRYQQMKDRKQSLGAGLLLKKCMEEYDISIEEIQYGEHGKPEVDGICFNLSHSKDMVVCAVSDKPVGCDIEQIAEVKDGVAQRFFTKNENYYLEQFQGDKKRDEFYRLWTMKESYMKMTGEGMSLTLDCFEFEMGDEVHVWRDGKLCRCNIREYKVEGYKLTVCARENEFKLEIQHVTL